MEGDYVYSRSICMATNANCNLKCTYCYEKEKKNVGFDVKEALMVLDGILRKKTDNGTKIKLHGGEPFLVFSKIKQLCESLWENQYSEYFHFHITTNGTLVHGEIQDWLYEHREQITVKLSLDGNEHSNDINRPDSFKKIDIPFFVHTWPNVRINMTITPETLPYISENVQYLHSLGFNDILAHFSLMTDWSNCNLEKLFYAQLLQLVKYYLDNPQIKPWSFFTYDISRTVDDEPYLAPCNIGQLKAYDFQTRKYYPCHMFFPSVGGEKISEELSKINLNKLEKTEDDCCMRCPFIKLCITCYAENYISRGSISRRDMSLCSYQKINLVALFKYEYVRILSLKNPSSNDVKKMLAIKKWYQEITAIERSII
jgi:uncharacterized protein